MALVLAFVTYVSLTWWKPGGIPASLALAMLLITFVLWFINPVPPPLPSLQQASAGRTWLAMNGYALATLLAFIAYGSLALWRPGEYPASLALAVLLGMVALFVVVLALIGGAVSISRRIPEFQRRNDPSYVATAEEPFMPPYRVRESVVFQIMQLVSASFLAIATLQVIEPNNLASASTLAFATGFFSETILYMIRGMVKGLQPELTKVVGQAMVNLIGLLSWQDKLNPGDFAELHIQLRPQRPGEWRSVPVDKDRNFAINSVAAGHYKLVVRREGIIQPVAEQDIAVDDKPHKLIAITVTKA